MTPFVKCTGGARPTRVGTTLLGRTPRGRAVLGAVLTGSALLVGCGADPASEEAGADSSSLRIADLTETPAEAPRVTWGSEAQHLFLGPDLVLQMRHGPAVLVNYGPARVAVREVALEADAASVLTWGEGQIDPAPRRVRRHLEFTGPGEPDAAGAVAWIPPTPAEATPAPARWQVSFAEGGVLEIEAESGVDEPGAPQRAGANVLARGWRAMGAAVSDLGGDAPAEPRIRLTLPDSVAGRLYRSLEPGVVLVVALPAGG